MGPIPLARSHQNPLLTETLRRAITILRAPRHIPLEAQKPPLTPIPLPTVPSAVAHTRHPTLAAEQTQPPALLTALTLPHLAPLALQNPQASPVARLPHLAPLAQQNHQASPVASLTHLAPLALQNHQASPAASLHTPLLRESLRSTTITTRSQSAT